MLIYVINILLLIGVIYYTLDTVVSVLNLIKVDIVDF